MSIDFDKGSYPPSIHWEASKDTHPQWVVTETSDEGEVTTTSFDSRKEADDYVVSLTPVESEDDDDVDSESAADPSNAEKTTKTVAKKSAAKK